MNQPIPGATTILAPLEVRNNPDLPVTDLRHIKGGSWSLPDIASRNLIPVALREKNVTRCYVEADGKTYILRGGIDNANWAIDTSTGAGGGSKKGINKFLSALVLYVGQPFEFDLPDDLFGPAPISYDSLAAQNLPAGISLEAPARLTGTPTQLDVNVLVINAALTTGEKLQYLLPYKTLSLDQVASSVGVVALDVSFGAMNPDNPSELVYDFDLALQVNEPGLSTHGQRAVPGVSARFIGDNTIAGCLAVAALSKQTVPGNAPIRFYRFGISLVKLRQMYPNQIQVRFDIRGKRKTANPSTNAGNKVYFRVGRDLTSGLLAAGMPIGFESANPTLAGPPVDYTNQSGLGYAVNASESLLAYLIVELGSGNVFLFDVAGAPEADPVAYQAIVYGDAIEFDVADDAPMIT